MIVLICSDSKAGFAKRGASNLLPQLLGVIRRQCQLYRDSCLKHQKWLGSVLSSFYIHRWVFLSIFTKMCILPPPQCIHCPTMPLETSAGRAGVIQRSSGKQQVPRDGKGDQVVLSGLPGMCQWRRCQLTWYRNFTLRA